MERIKKRKRAYKVKDSPTCYLDGNEKAKREEIH